MPTGHSPHGNLFRLLLALGTLLSLGEARSAATDFYVSSSGNDGWSGRHASPDGRGGGPFATLEAARDAVRRLKASTGLPEGGVTIWIASGAYSLNKGFALTAEDSGEPAKPVVYRATSQGQARIMGGRIVTGWQAVNDAATRDRLEPAARGHVLQADLRAQSVNDFGKLRSRGFGRSGMAGLELFFRDRPMTLSRWPNADFVKIAKPVEPTGDEHGGTLGKLPAGFYYEGDRPGRWADTNDIWIHGYWAYDWANSYEHIASLDTQKRLIRTSPPHGNYGFRTGQRFYFLNILEELDEPGEWYLDRKTGILYFWPPEPIAAGDVTVSVVEEPLLSLNDVSHVEFRGLAFVCCRANAVSIEGGSGNRITSCTICDIGNSGVVVTGGDHHGIEDCVISETGDGGISLTGGDRSTLTPCGHFARNNHIHHVARWSRCYAPAIAISGVGVVAANNLIHDHPHCAILFGGNEHMIELNEIHHVCLETGDVGAIYTGRDYTFRGNVIRHNFIHHTGGVGMGSMGIYMDDCVSGTQMFGNVLWKLHRAVFLGGGRDFDVQNNIFVDCDPAVELDGRGMSKAPVWHDMVYKTMKQRLEDMNWRQPPYQTQYPRLADLEQYYAKDEGLPPGNVVVSHNICVNTELLKITWGATPEAVESSDNLVNVDPLFFDAANGDFRLKPESPAYAQGFKPIPFDRIGRKPNPVPTGTALPAAVQHSFTFGEKEFLLDGKSFQIVSGEIHPARVPSEYWRHRIQMAKAMGCNTISAYIFWNHHESEPGVFDFETGNHNLAEFFRLVQEEGLWAILRPGPYVCAEWDFGGLPPYLLRVPDIKVRCMDPRYMAAVERYLAQMASLVKPLLCANGGPILMIQVENEYGSFGNDKNYMERLRQIWKEHGIDGPFFTGDGATPFMLEAGNIDGAAIGLDPGSNEGAFAQATKRNPKVPSFSSETYPGWLTHWGEPWAQRDTPSLLREVTFLLENKKSFNFYVIHGGTNFGFMAGANSGGKGYEPDVTSYDYDAPIDEQGRPTPKYFALRELIAKYAGPLPNVPTPIPTVEIPEIPMEAFTSVWGNLPEPIHSVQPKPFEAYEQDYGFMLYKTELIGHKSGKLTITELHDYATVFLNGQFVGTLDRREAQSTIDLPQSEVRNPVLEILVEGMGRINFAQSMIDRKGITDRVTLNGMTLMNWDVYRLPFDERYIRRLEKSPVDAARRGVFFRGVFNLDAPADTFIDLANYRKGVVWVNGHNLGRFWEIGPQKRLYCPAPWLKKGQNEVFVFDLLQNEAKPLCGWATLR